MLGGKKAFGVYAHPFTESIFPKISPLYVRPLSGHEQDGEAVAPRAVERRRRRDVVGVGGLDGLLQQARRRAFRASPAVQAGANISPTAASGRLVTGGL